MAGQARRQPGLLMTKLFWRFMASARSIVSERFETRKEKCN